MSGDPLSFTPYKDNVFVLLDGAPKETASGIQLGGDSCEFGDKYLTGEVVAAGPGGWGYHGPSLVDESRHDVKQKRRWFSVDVEKGQRVLFRKDRGEPLAIDNKAALSPQNEREREYRVLRNSEIEMIVG